MDEKENQWKDIECMNISRLYFGATSIGEKIYVMRGSSNSDDRFLCSGEVYDSNCNKWSLLPDMKRSRRGCAVTSVNGRVYVMGGLGGNKRLSSCEMFDPVTNQWTSLPDRKEARYDCTACTMDDKIYVIGGHDTAYNCLSSVEVFDTTTMTWSSSIPDRNLPRCYCAAVSVEKQQQIYVFGGYNEDGHPTTTRLSCVEMYDIPTQKWTILDSTMKEKRNACTATLVGTKIYIIGGQGDNDILHSSCEVFDTLSNTFCSPSPTNMKDGKAGCQAVSIGSQIYVIGGSNGFTSTSSVQLLQLSSIL